MRIGYIVKYRKVLLDTNVILNFVFTPQKISTRIKDYIDDEIFKGEQNLNISSISAFEIGILVKKNRISIGSARDFWERLLLEWKPFVINPNAEIYLKSCELFGVNNDPCDRILIATSLSKKFPLITSDNNLLKWADSDNGKNAGFTAINAAL